MSNDVSTPLYSPHPAESIDPQGVIQAAWQPGRDQKEAMLPWPMESLSGTIWRNLSTGLPMRIDHIGIDQQGRPVPVAEVEGKEEPDEYSLHLGWWRDNRFCIELWVRVDHLPPSAQIAWLEIEIAFHRQQMIQTGGPPLARKQALEAVTIAVKHMRNLAERHNLPLPPGFLLHRTFPGHVPPVKETPEKSDVRLRASQLWQETFDSLLTQLPSAPVKIVLDVPCPSINNLSRLDEGAQEYLHALFVGETIAECCARSSAYEEHSHVYFVLHPKDNDELARKLLWLAPLFHEAAEERDLEDDEDEYASPLSTFAETLEQRTLHFPELGDGYLAHFAMSQSDFLEESADEESNDHPEWTYGFWRSCVSNHMGIDVYRSSSIWMLPLVGDVEQLLVNYAGFEEGIPDLYEAYPLVVGNFLPLVFHARLAVRYPLDDIINAQRCAEALYAARRNILERDAANTEITNIWLSEQGNLLIATDAIAQYILFKDTLPDIPLETLHLIQDDLAVFSSLTHKSS